MMRRSDIALMRAVAHYIVATWREDLKQFMDPKKYFPMNKRQTCCLFLVFFLSFQVRGQICNDVQAISKRSDIWNAAYNSRDSLSFYSLFDSTAILISAIYTPLDCSGSYCSKKH